METVFASSTRKLPKSGKRRICFPITSRAYYGRSQLLIRKLHDHPDIELELMLGGSILLDKYSRHIAEDIEGGDVTGSIDESVRHAITKLAHIHFVTNADAHRRVLAMGEDPAYVFNTGSLDVELAARVDTVLTNERLNGYGVGHEVDVTKPFITVIQHPVTTESDNRQHLEATLKAV